MGMLPREQIQPDRRKNINSIEFKKYLLYPAYPCLYFIAMTEVIDVWEIPKPE